MSEVPFRPFAIAAVVVFGAAGALVPPAAYAATTTASCANLQAHLDAAQNGDDIILTEVCHGQTFTIAGPIKLTLEGSGGAGFFGVDGGSILTVNDASITLKDLFFENGNQTTSGLGAGLYVESSLGKVTLNNVTFQDLYSAGAGGAAYIHAGTVTIRRSLFGSMTLAGSGNASDGPGGSLYLRADTATLVGNHFGGGSSGASGGGAALAVGALTMRANVFGSRARPNTATYEGGGVFATVGTATLEGNSFRWNRVVTLGDGLGGGLAIEPPPPTFARLATGPGSGSGPPVTQSANVFDSNVVQDDGTGGNVRGGGEFIDGISASSTNDRFTGNSLPDGGVGGGLYVLAGYSFVCPNVVFTGRNLVAAGNKAGIGGVGGVAFGASSVCSSNPAVKATLDDSTVAQNKARSGTGGIDAGALTHLNVTNSIVTENVGKKSGISSVERAVVSWSDVCRRSGFTHSGTGNICVDPLLAGSISSPDVHLTVGSPVIDQGSNALVPPDLTTDMDGEPRIADGNGDNVWVVDMGADEYA